MTETDGNRMNCDEVRELIGAYADGELTPDERSLIEEHIKDCGDCSTLLDEVASISKQLRDIPPFPLPPGLNESVLEQLDTVDRSVSSHHERFPWFRMATHTGALAAGISIAVIASFFPEDSNKQTSDIVTAHLRHTMSEQFGIIHSSERHTVRPWFIGKIDYAPPVIDLSDSGFPLISGRVEYIKRRTVAALSYGRRRHKISLIILPVENSRSSDGEHRSVRGFNIVRWNDGQFSYQAVSDVNSADLKSFAQLMKGKLNRAALKRPAPGTDR